MIKALENCFFDQPMKAEITGWSAQIKRILNRTIDEKAVNIVGTVNSREVQLYGWQSPVPTHSDYTGFIFFMPLSMESSTDQLIYEDQIIDLKIGQLYLMDDCKPHSTLGLGNVIALFVGAYKEDEISDELIAEVYKNCLAFLTH